MTDAELALLTAALSALAKVEPAIAEAVSELVADWRAVQPLTPAIKKLEAVALAKSLGLAESKV
jgi:hypothetical protein